MSGLTKEKAFQLILGLCAEFNTMEETSNHLRKLFNSKEIDSFSFLLGQATKDLLRLLLSRTVYQKDVFEKDIYDKIIKVKTAFVDVFDPTDDISRLALALNRLRELEVISKTFQTGFFGGVEKEGLSNENIIEMIGSLSDTTKVKEEMRFATVLNFGREPLSPKMDRSSTSPATSVSISPEVDRTEKSPEGGVLESKPSRPDFSHP